MKTSGEVCQAGFKRARPNRSDANGVGSGIVAIPPVDRFETSAEFALILSSELIVGLSKFRSAPLVQDEGGFAMQPVGGPIGRDVTSVTPNGAYFHTA